MKRKCDGIPDCIDGFDESVCKLCTQLHVAFHFYAVSAPRLHYPIVLCMSLTMCEVTSVVCVNAGPMTVDELPVRRPSLIDIIPPDSQFFDHADWAWRRSYVKLVVDNSIL